MRAVRTLAGDRDTGAALTTSSERRDAITRHARALDTLVSLVATSEHWPARKRPASWYVGGYLQRLLAHVVRADQVLTWEEISLLQEYFGHDLYWQDEDAWSRRITEQFPDLPMTTPEFFVASCRYDASNGTDVSLRILAAIEDFCRCAATIDDVLHPNEEALIQSVVATLRSTSQGLAASRNANGPTGPSSR